MATHDSQDLDGRQRNLEHELREALRLGRHRVAVETLAERGCKVIHTGGVVFRYRVSADRSFSRAQADHAEVYRRLKHDHPRLFSNIREHRRRSNLPWIWKVSYPLLYAGGMPRFSRARHIVRTVVRTWSPALRS